jgi:hypothetical protein
VICSLEIERVNVVVAETVPYTQELILPDIFEE